MSGMFEQVAYRPFKDIPLVTALPSNPSNGDMIVLTDSLTAGTYQWMFKYVAARASNKWVFIGGTPLEAEVSTLETTAATAYTALTTAGPSVTIPVAGDYFVEHGAEMYATAVAAIFHSYDIGGTGAVDADGVQMAAGAANLPISGSRIKKKTGLTAIALVSKYKTSAGTASFEKRFIAVTPIAIGG